MPDPENSESTQQTRQVAPTDVSTEQRPASDSAAPSEQPPPQVAAKGTPNAQSEVLVGTLLDGRYFIEKELGRGGVGVVYLALDRKLLNKPVVVKVLLEKSLRFERIVQKFQQEKEALTRVDHPGIVGILDTGELDDGKPYIVMQHIDGVPLRDVLRPEGIDLERAADIIKQTCEALAAAHDKGIFHRDLKPENIMLQGLSGGRERVRIIDFGIAKVKDSLVASSTVMPMRAGTYWYMSPEQFRAERVTAASDVYSLGVIAYEMVTGRRPFNADSISQLGELLRQGVKIKPKDLRPSLPDSAQDVILKALSLLPAARYQNACDFGEALERALTSEPDVVQDDFEAGVSTQTLPHKTKLSGIYKKPAAIGAGVIALLLMGVAVALFSSRFGAASDAVGSNTVTSSAPAAERTLSYWLTVQKTRDGKPYQQPFQSSGQEIFENGYKFQMNVLSPQAGYLYLVNEGASSTGAIKLNLIYPTPNANQGSGLLMNGQSARTGWNVFRGQPGTEQFWMVWSASPVEQFEAARDDAFKNENGAITDAGILRKVREYLMKNGEQKPEVKKDAAKRETIVKSKGELLVNLVELEHR